MTRYVADYAGLAKLLRGVPPAGGLVVNLFARGTRVAIRAAELSHEETGRLKASWRVKVNDPGGFAKDRLEVEVYSDDPAAIFEELGNGHNIAPHTLLKATTAAGGDA